MVSQIGTQMFSLALLYWILETTGSATIMGLVLMAAALPGALLGPFGGTLADNLSRKRLIVFADLIRGVVAIGFVLILWHGDSLWFLPMLFVSQVIFGICNSVFTPALNASIPEIVPKQHLASANSLLQGTNAVTSTISMGIGGFLYAIVGGPIMFLINGISYLFSAATECFISIPQKRPAEPMTRSNAARKFRVDTMTGLRFAWERKGLRILLMVTALLNFVLVPTGIAMPILVRDFLDKGPEFLGLMGACQSAGAIAGFVLVGTLKIPPSYRPHIVAGGICLIGLLIVLLGLNEVPEGSLVLLVFFGFLLPLVNVNIITVIQGTTPSEIRGRVVGLLSTMALGLIPISQGLSGLLIDAVDQQVPVIYLTVGATSVLFICVAWSTEAYRTFLATDFERPVPKIQPADSEANRSRPGL